MRLDFGRTMFAAGLALAVMTGSAAAQTKVVIGSAGANVFRMPMYVAIYQGFFKEEGIEASIVENRSGADTAKMLAGNAVQFATGPAIDLFNLRRQQFPVVSVSLMCNRLSNSLIVSKAKAGEIKSAKDLKGRTVGVTGIGSGTWQYLMLMLAEAGLKAEDVKVVALGSDPGVISTALKSGNVDANTYGDPFNYQLVQEGAAVFLSDGLDDKTHTELVGGEVMFNQMYATEDYVKNNPKVVQSFVNALQKGLNWIHASTDAQVAELAKKYAGFNSYDMPVMTMLVQRSRICYPQNGVSSEAAFGRAINVMTKIGVLKDKIAFKDAVDNSFAENAAKSFPPKK